MMDKFFRFLAKKIFWGGYRHFLSDEQYMRVRYWLEFGEKLNLKHPKSFNEKVQYIKLHQRETLRKLAADRIRVRQYVKEKIGMKYLVPLEQKFDVFDIEVWNTLPNQFVLKANHGCGMIKIIKDKNETNHQEIKKLVEKWQDFDYYKFSREWVYKDLPRTILAEKLLLTENQTIPRDFKFFCFNGRVEMIQIDFGRFSHQTRNLYDRDFQLLPANIFYKNFPHPVTKPENLDEAIEVAERLSQRFDFIRVDLYLMEKHIYFGELTNYPGNGFGKFDPPSFDIELGQKWDLE